MASAEQEHERDLAELKRVIANYLLWVRRYRESELVRKANQRDA